MRQENQANTQNSVSDAGNGSSFVAEKVSGWLGRMFGCRHRDLSRPFSSEGQTYRTCVACGARRSFSVGKWEMRGGFYYNLPTSRHFRVLSGLTPKPAKLNAVISGVRQTSQYA